ncbi:spermidine synthase [Nitzschia inconspicua]|uniref:Spermidine synthase n=1 Tax=Nitzschia inconspicua TaxID=303405 RepID=A0A9K3KTP4_9STRA|nr:spermidine synthase [Nitzschia inconspicua]
MRKVSPLFLTLLGILTNSAIATVSSKEIEPTCDYEAQTNNNTESCPSYVDGSSDEIAVTSLLHKNVIDWVVKASGLFSDKQEIRLIQKDSALETFGVFAATDIPKGELLARIPGNCIVADWDEELDAEPWDDGGTFYCATTQKLLKEAELGESSEYAPYVTFLTKQTLDELPFYWSEGGQQLLLEVLGYNSLYKEHAIPPRFPFYNQIDYKERCHRERQIDFANQEGDDTETLLAMQVMQRSYFEHMIPVFDFYNHVNGPAENIDVKFFMNHETGAVKEVQISARRDILKGEELRRSYNQAKNMGDRVSPFYGTPDFLRDFGFVEEYPRRWTFLNKDFKVGFDLSHKNDTALFGGDDSSIPMNELKLKWLSWSRDNYSYEINAHFRRHLQRMKDSLEPKMEEIQKKIEERDLYPKDDLPSDREFAIIRKYLDGLKVAFKIFLEATNYFKLHGKRMHPYREIHRQRGKRHPFDHETFPTYNEQYYVRPGTDEGWEILSREASGYQTITFTGHDNGANVCFVLDREPQTCSYFSAHYHDLACHFPTRYLHSVKRVAIIGGGDSKMLEDVLQYNQTLEKVIHLELDQKGTRQCFKYFATEPHFDDDRIEWYFGDAAKSLLMIPSEYFGTFDLVFVDLSESGPLSLAVTTNLTVWDSIAQLLAPDGIIVKNEVYMEEMSEMFDHTLMLYYEQVPIIESWALTFATNRKDLLTPDPDTMNKWHDIKTHLSNFQATSTDVNEHFLLAHDYRQNDARAQGRCEVGASASGDNTPLAGLLVIIDAEDISVDAEILQDWSKIERLLMDVLVDELGFSKLSSISNRSKTGEILGTVIFQECAVTARTWPAERYCALDVQIWSSFHKLHDVKRLLVEKLSSHTTSSFRVITSGIRGTSTESEDRKNVGPPGINNRDCGSQEDVVEATVAEMVPTIDPTGFRALIHESLGMIQETKGTVVVMCGDQETPCPSFEAISLFVVEANTASDWDLFPVAFWSCPGTETVTSPLMEEHQLKSMLACNEKTLNQMEHAVNERGPIVVFVIDQSAPLNMGMVADRIWRDESNQHLLADRFTFLSPMVDPSNEVWRREFLDLRRAEMIDYGHLFRAEVVMQLGNKVLLELGVLSGQDKQFFSRLTNVTDAIKKSTGIPTRIRLIEGGVEEIDLDPQHVQWIRESEYDRPGESHFQTQNPFGEQHLHQFSVKSSGTTIDHYVLERILWMTFHPDVTMRMETVGRGLVFAGISPQGTVLVVWDGDGRVDVDVFSSEIEFRERAVAPFKSHLHLEQQSFDEFPRGVGRVINLPRDILDDSADKDEYEEM